MAANYPSSITDTVFAITHRSQARASDGVVFKEGEVIDARFGMNRKVGTILNITNNALLVHLTGLPKGSQELISLSEGWHIVHVDEQP